jgi:glycine/D-amino acid oxidase-like deaminating enzyme/nitrite reductase/ring-hydroxylating ferredoxin subunit
MKKQEFDLEQTSNNSGRTKSLWMEVPLPCFPSLDEDVKADVCIVGAGIVGLTCAYTLAKAGKSVIVLDQGAIGGGQTARTTAHLTWALDDRYYELENIYGLKGSQLAAESHSQSIDYIEKIVHDEKIDCDFERVDGYLFLSAHDSMEELNKEEPAIEKIGMPIKRISKAPIESFDTGTCLQFPNQGQFHILKYLKGLINAILKHGGQIFSNTHVNHFEDGSPCIVGTAAGQKVKAKSVIVATCSPVNNRFMIHTKQAAYRTYVIAGKVPKGSVPNALYWETGDPYHYLRIQNHLTDPKWDWLIVGGEDHKTGQDGGHIEKRYHHLEIWVKKRFPMVKEFTYHWSGQVFEPVDSLGFIGRNPGDKHIYIATGDSGNGMTHGTIAGMLIPDLILGKENPWIELYDPSRKTLHTVGEYIEENANTALQYGDWFTPGEHKTIKALPADEGIILRKGLEKIAVYKDKEECVHLNSAFCPHLGGCVRWNSNEKSWDCPCHGSRFDACGRVITGPAKNNLSPYEQKEGDS